MRLLSGVIMISMCFGSMTAHAGEVPFSSDRWLVEAAESEQTEFAGRKCLMIKGGRAALTDVEFTDGTIEFDIAFTGARGFMGVMWRMVEGGNYEEFYIRPHQSGFADANQYTPLFNGSSAWQLYHGDGYGAPVKYPYNEWIHVKIVVSGVRADMYIDDMDTAVVVVPKMKRATMSGSVGVTCSNFAPAYFSNFSYSTTADISPVTNTEVPLDPSLVTIWHVSSSFSESSLEGVSKLTAAHRDHLSWQELKSEPTGITNLAQVQGVTEEKNAAFARVMIGAHGAQEKIFRFGYSDRVRVYLNGALLYVGNNTYQSRDFRYLGTVGWFDSVNLQLKDGENELWIAVAESFGGWGIMGRFDNLDGIEIR